jgi:hypothetical protein
MRAQFPSVSFYVAEKRNNKYFFKGLYHRKFCYDKGHRGRPCFNRVEKHLLFRKLSQGKDMK